MKTDVRYRLVDEAVDPRRHYYVFDRLGEGPEGEVRLRVITRLPVSRFRVGSEFTREEIEGLCGEPGPTGGDVVIPIRP